MLSHRSAAALWALRPTSRPVVELTTPAWRPGPANVRVHARAVPPDEASERDAIPVTTVPRTLVDLAAVLAPPELRRAVEQAEALRLADLLSLDAVVTRHHRRHGVRHLRAIVEEGVTATVTRSELERRFLALVELHALPRPQVNAGVRVGDHWIEADCVWRTPRVIVELDGHAYHSTRAAFERDRRRDRQLQVAGWRVVRLTWRQLADGAAVARDLAGLLTPPDRS